MKNWIPENEGIFSGVGTTIVASIIAALGYFFRKKKKSKNYDEKRKKSHLTKESIQILFIDDENFIIDRNLKKTGYPNVKKITDVTNLDSPDIIIANVIFVDIKGVGALLFPESEGLGLANAIKKRHPEKYICIYSAQPHRLNTHKLLSTLDGVLDKNAELFEFTLHIDKNLNENIN